MSLLRKTQSICRNVNAQQLCTLTKMTQDNEKSITVTPGYWCIFTARMMAYRCDWPKAARPRFHPIAPLLHEWSSECHLSAWHDESGQITIVLTAKKVWKFLRPIVRLNCIVVHSENYATHQHLLLKVVSVLDLVPPIHTPVGLQLYDIFYEITLNQLENSAQYIREYRWSITNWLVQLPYDTLKVWIDHWVLQRFKHSILSIFPIDIEKWRDHTTKGFLLFH